jgi:hypothetical protein
MSRTSASLASLTGLALLTVSAIAWTPVHSLAPAPGAAADVLRTNGCVFFDANGTAWFDADARIQIVTTNNPRGNQNVYCQGSLPAGATLPDRAMQFDFASTGFTCVGGQEWKMTVSPSGQASFTCHNTN